MYIVWGHSPEPFVFAMFNCVFPWKNYERSAATTHFQGHQANNALPAKCC